MRVDKFKTFLKEMNFKVFINTLHGSTGPYVEKIFLEDFGRDKSNVLPDFGGDHPDPDPNLTYAADLVKEMGSGKYSMGDTLDVVMILGQNAFFVTL